METQYRINYKSDFSFLLVLKDCDGQEIGWPACDWQAKFFTPGNKANAYFASSKGGVLTNCYNDSGFIHVVCDNHHLGIGRMNVELTMLQPNDDFPDGNERKSFSAQLNIELVRENATCEITKEIKAEVLLSMIHDTDVYAEVLDRVNGVLAGLLDGSGEAGKPTKQQSNFRISQWLTPGMMRNTARPGMVYVLRSKERGSMVALNTGRKKQGTIDISKLFPGGKFYDEPINVYARNTSGSWGLNDPGRGKVDYDPETGIVTFDFSAVPGQLCKFPIVAEIISTGVDPSAQVMINEEGRLVYAPQRLSFMPAPTFEFRGEFNNDGHEGTKNEPRKPHTAQADDGRKLEVMRHHKRRLDGTGIYIGQWRHIYGSGLNYALIIKVRYKSRRGHRTPWRTFLRPKTKSGHRSVVGELK